MSSDTPETKQEAPQGLDAVILKLAYPTLMFGAVLTHWIMLQTGMGLSLSVYVPILLAIVAIIVLERRYPYNKSWAPQGSDVPTDLSFLLLMQGLLPQLILVTAFFLLIDLQFLQAQQRVEFWPYHWPLIVQALLIMLLVDFAIYWMHRALHTVACLWPFHAVHHSPQKLYWLNVGRDHPLETTLLFVFGMLPFYFLGIDEKVLAFYLVVFDIHAFFQHSNIDIRYGRLNYVLSTAELHRWHHATDAKISNHNYGNTFIFWDLLFGTWWFPHRDCTHIGLKNRNYPLGFFDLMRTPFVKGLTDHDVPFKSTKALLLDFFRRLFTFRIEKRPHK